MLLNLSNHPSNRWTDHQQRIARQTYGSIEDLPFPRIPAEADEAELEQLVETYYRQVTACQPTAVHLMGEMTFTYGLVNRLRADGIPVVASTTERIVEERDGKKIVQFNFIRFRAYR